MPPKAKSIKTYRPHYTLTVECDLEGRLHRVVVTKDSTNKDTVIARNLTRDEAEALLAALEPIADRLCL